MEKATIKAEIRKGNGKSLARKLRKAGSIPAILYGKDTQPIQIVISKREWERLSRDLKRNTIIDLEVGTNGSSETKIVMVKSVQRGFPSNEVIHIDFLQVSMERTIEVEIPVHLVGESRGVKLGGILEQHLRTIRAECLPTQIPELIEIDVSKLEVGDSIHINEIALPGVKLVEAGEIALVTVIPPETEAKAASEEEAATESEKEE